MLNAILLAGAISGAGGGLGSILLIVVIVAIFYFFMIRPLPKKLKGKMKADDKTTIPPETHHFSIDNNSVKTPFVVYKAFYMIAILAGIYLISTYNNYTVPKLYILAAILSSLFAGATLQILVKIHEDVIDIKRQLNKDNNDKVL